jgi:hypothetical protein
MYDCKIIQGVWVAPKMYMMRYLAHYKDGRVELKEHIVGKGVKKINKNIPLTLNDFMNMYEGKTLAIKNRGVFKRFAYKLNKQEIIKGTDYFSVCIRDCEKTLNVRPWKGRNFITKNDSVPNGYDESLIENLILQQNKE